MSPLSSLHTPQALRPLKEQATFFLVILFVVAYKSNDALSHPQFWAEDATVFFSDQFGREWPQLTSPYAGYLHTLPRLVAWFASWFAPGKAPLIYNAAAVMLATVAIVFTCRRVRPYIPVWIVALSFLAVPTSGEIFGTITNAQWFLQFAMAVYCLAPAQPMTSTPRSWLRALGILLVSLTGPFSVLLLAVLALITAASWLSRRSGVDPFAGALSGFAGSRDGYAVWPVMTGAIVQICVMAAYPPAQSAVMQPLLPAFQATFTKIVPIHTFGSDFLTGTSWLVIYALLLAALLQPRRRDGGARVLVLGLLALGSLECYAPMLRVTELAPMYSLGAADRYFYLIKVVWWWAVWLALDGGSMRSRVNATAVTTALVCLIAVSNAQFLRRYALTNFNWRAHAAVLDQPGAHTIPINPSGWSITVDGDTSTRGAQAPGMGTPRSPAGSPAPP